MKLNRKYSTLFAAIAIATPFSFTAPSALAQQADQIEELVIVGSRRDPRSAADSIAPVDVISGADFTANATSDISDLLRVAVPSYNVNTQPISDAATIVRPANLRGLSSDHTLVLLNGKRRHRASVISFLGGGISDGAHGPDVGVFPSIGLKQVEVLRDGASSQYGSDAIAGVINFTLKDDREGGAVELKWGSTYAGDGDNYRLSGNIGLPLGVNGFVNISAEFIEADDTIRSVQRTDAAQLIAAGNADVTALSVNTVTSDVTQIWGQPNVNDDFKIFVNSGYEFNDSLEVYAFANYAERQVEGGFFYRNPTNRAGVYAGPSVDPVTGALSTADDAVASILVGDLSVSSEMTGDPLIDTAGDCPAGIPLTGAGGLIPNQAVLDQVTASDNCFSFVELFPGGFVPRFGGDTSDAAIVIGARGTLSIGEGLNYDISYSYGNNETVFFINNTVNASLGPAQPFGNNGVTSFNPGAYEQTDNNFNLDVSYGLPVGFASDLNIAAGFEARSEEFSITEGDLASRQLGVLSSPSIAFPAGQGFASSSNGFGGFVLPDPNRPLNDPNSVTEDFSQNNIALYLDVETDIIDSFSVQGAIRYENFNTFGSTFDWKLGVLFKATDNLRFRSTISTGFRAPTTGQANVVNVSTVFVAGILADQGTIPLSSGAGQFINGRRADPFTLNPEESVNFSLGTGFNVGGWAITLDYFNVKVDDRIALSPTIDFLAELQAFALENGVSSAGLNTSQLINTLDSLANFNAADFSGSEDLSTFSVFTNNFDTSTQGLDLVANYPFTLVGGDANLSVAVNYTNTNVTNRGRFEDLGDLRIRSLEENIPNWKGNIALTNSNGDWRWLVRANFHGAYFEDHLGNNGFPVDLGGEVTFDVELGYEISKGFELTAGASNVTDNFPDELPADIAGIAGARYPSTAPYGFNGGQYYFRARYSF